MLNNAQKYVKGKMPAPGPCADFGNTKPKPTYVTIPRALDPSKSVLDPATQLWSVNNTPNQPELFSQGVSSLETRIYDPYHSHSTVKDDGDKHWHKHTCICCGRIEHHLHVRRTPQDQDAYYDKNTAAAHCSNCGFRQCGFNQKVTFQVSEVRGIGGLKAYYLDTKMPFHPAIPENARKFDKPLFVHYVLKGVHWYAKFDKEKLCFRMSFSTSVTQHLVQLKDGPFVYDGEIRENDHHLQLGNPPSVNHFKIHERAITSYMPQRDYHRRTDEKKTCLHWGQKKLLIQEIEFLTQNMGEDNRVLYIGASPGTHIPILSEWFPTMAFILYDPEPIRFTPNARTRYYNKRFERADAKLMQGCLLISDIRTMGATYTDSEKYIAGDMQNQREIYHALKPRAALMKFRLPYNHGVTFYPEGELLLPIWGPQTTTEVRLRTKKYWGLEHDVAYGHKHLENQMFYFNTVFRPANFYDALENKDHFPLGYDTCYDCVGELNVIDRYMNTKYRGHFIRAFERVPEFDFKRKLEEGNILPEKRRRTYTEDAAAERKKVVDCLVNYWQHATAEPFEILAGLKGEISEYEEAKTNAQAKDEAGDVLVLSLMLYYRENFGPDWMIPKRVEFILDMNKGYYEKIHKRIMENGCPRSTDHHRPVDHPCPNYNYEYPLPVGSNKKCGYCGGDFTSLTPKMFCSSTCLKLSTLGKAVQTANLDDLAAVCNEVRK